MAGTAVGDGGRPCGTRRRGRTLGLDHPVTRLRGLARAVGIGRARVVLRPGAALPSRSTRRSRRGPEHRAAGRPLGAAEGRPVAGQADHGREGAVRRSGRRTTSTPGSAGSGLSRSRRSGHSSASRRSGRVAKESAGTFGPCPGRKYGSPLARLVPRFLRIPPHSGAHSRPRATSRLRADHHARIPVGRPL